MNNCTIYWYCYHKNYVDLIILLKFINVHKYFLNVNFMYWNTIYKLQGIKSINNLSVILNLKICL